MALRIMVLMSKGKIKWTSSTYPPHASCSWLLIKMKKTKEKNENKIKNEDEISKLIKAFPKDIAALDKRSVLAKVNSQGSGQ